MDNLLFFDDKDIPQVTHHDENFDNDYNDYNRPNSSLNEKQIKMPGSIQATSTLRLKQKVEHYKSLVLYR